MLLSQSILKNIINFHGVKYPTVEHTLFCTYFHCKSIKRSILIVRRHLATTFSCNDRYKSLQIKYEAIRILLINLTYRTIVERS